MKRWVALAAILAAVAAGVAVGVLTRASASAAQPRTLRGVVAQVRKSFGDNRLVRAKVTGSHLHLVVRPGRPRMKSDFEGAVLAAAVADWMRARGENPITAVRSPGPGTGLDGIPVPTAAGVSALRPGTCRSVAKASVRSVRWDTRLGSVKQLPYLQGTCVIRIRTADVAAAALVVGPIKLGLGDPEKRPFLLELDDLDGIPQAAYSWMPGLNGSEWARADIQPFPFVHM